MALRKSRIDQRDGNDNFPEYWLVSKFGIVRLGLEPLLEHVRLGSSACELSLDICCLRSFAWDHCLGSFALKRSLKQLSLGIFRLAIFAWRLSPRIFHLVPSTWGCLLAHFGLGNCRLEMFALGRSLGKLRLGITV